MLSTPVSRFAACIGGIQITLIKECLHKNGLHGRQWNTYVIYLRTTCMMKLILIRKRGISYYLTLCQQAATLRFAFLPPERLFRPFLIVTEYILQTSTSVVDSAKACWSSLAWGHLRWNSQSRADSWVGACQRWTGANLHSRTWVYRTGAWIHNHILNQMYLRLGQAGSGLCWYVFYLIYYIVLNNNCVNITCIICVLVANKYVLA